MKKLLMLSVLSGIFLLGCSPTVVVTQPTPSPAASQPSSPDDSKPSSPVTSTVNFTPVKSIIDQRCVSCHSGTRPSDSVALDTPQNIKSNAKDIYEEVAKKSMPPQGSMPDSEIALIGTWYNAGAPLTDSPAAAPSAPATTQPSPAPVSGSDFTKVKAVIEQKCSTCHSTKYNTADKIKAEASSINDSTVSRKSMPPNPSSITDAERALIGTWFSAGAPIN